MNPHRAVSFLLRFPVLLLAVTLECLKVALQLAWDLLHVGMDVAEWLQERVKQMERAA